MAIRFIDAMASYGIDQILERYDSLQGGINMMYRNWSPKGSVEGNSEPACAAAGRFGGAALTFATSYGSFVQKTLPASNSDLHILSFNFLYRNAATSPTFSPTDGTRAGVLACMIPGTGPTGRTSLTLAMDDNGGVSVLLGGYVNNLGGARIGGGRGFSIDKWAQITVELKIGVTDGYVKIYVENTAILGSYIMDLVFDSGLIDTQAEMFDLNNPFGALRLAQPGNFQGRFDEVFVQDGLTSSNNAFLGKVHVKSNHNGIFSPGTDFANEGGIQNNHPGAKSPESLALQVIDEERVGNRSCEMVLIPSQSVGVHRGDASFMESKSPGDRLVVSPGFDEGILSVQVSINSRKTTAATTSYQFLADKSGQEFLAGSASTSSTYSVDSHVFDSDPDDGSFWTLTKASSYRWGLKKD